MNLHELRDNMLAQADNDAERVIAIEPTALADLGFGAAIRLPRQLYAPARVIFPDTAPLDGQRAVTVFAELDEDGKAIELTFRPERL
jgi:hypothetical protein